MLNHHPWYKLLIGIILLSQLVNLTACTASPVNPTASPSPTITETLFPTLSPTPAFTLTPSQSATASLTPTQVRTPTLTSTPPGSFYHFDAGFSVSFPSFWKVVHTGRTELVVSAPDNYLYVLISSRAERESQTMEQVISRLKDDFKAHSLLIGKTKLIDLPDQVQAQTADVNAMFEDTEQDWRIIYAHHASRGYTLVEIAKPGNLKKNEALLERLLESLHFFTPQPFGLAHDQTLVMVGSDPKPNDLDPAVTTSSSAGYVGLLYSGLVQLNAQLQIIPNLAEKWVVNQDGLVYTFSMKPGLKFANNAPLTAKDVKNSWERACDPKTASTTAATYLGDIKGAKEKLEKKADSISGLKVIDDTTLEVTLTSPITYFLAKLTYPTAAVLDVSSTLTGPENWTYSPNSSGPYKVKEYKKDEEIQFERNKNYPQPAKIAYLAFIFGGGAALDLYEEGTVDMSGIDSKDVGRASQPDDPLNKDLHSIPSLCTSMIQLNPTKPPLDDRNVRLALALATDKRAYIQQQTENTALLANSILPPAMPGYQAEHKLPDYDAEAAKEALKASRYAGHVPPIILTASGYGDAKRKDVAEIVDMWQKTLGIQVQVQYLDPLNYTGAARANPGHAVLYNWCADYPDPQNFLDLLFHSKSDFNVTQTSDAEFDKLVELAGIEKDASQRLGLYQQAERLLLEKVYSIPLLYPVFYEVVKPRVKGFVMTPMGVNLFPILQIESTPR